MVYEDNERICLIDNDCNAPSEPNLYTCKDKGEIALNIIKLVVYDRYYNMLNLVQIFDHVLLTRSMSMSTILHSEDVYFCDMYQSCNGYS